MEKFVTELNCSKRDGDDDDSMAHRVNEQKRALSSCEFCFVPIDIRLLKMKYRKSTMSSCCCCCWQAQHTELTARFTPRTRVNEYILSILYYSITVHSIPFHSIIWQYVYKFSPCRMRWLYSLSQTFVFNENDEICWLRFLRHSKEFVVCITFQ